MDAEYKVLTSRCYSLLNQVVGIINDRSFMEAPDGESLLTDALLEKAAFQCNAKLEKTRDKLERGVQAMLDKAAQLEDAREPEQGEILLCYMKDASLKQQICAHILDTVDPVVIDTYIQIFAHSPALSPPARD